MSDSDSDSAAQRIRITPVHSRGNFPAGYSLIYGQVPERKESDSSLLHYTGVRVLPDTVLHVALGLREPGIVSIVIHHDEIPIADTMSALITGLSIAYLEQRSTIVIGGFDAIPPRVDLKRVTAHPVDGDESRTVWEIHD
ncbi:hypothetical protein [Frankia sp. R82]|uniref:hypothetical protein n=1 Tax=Frankia sp. R82 TaxID=2950553 RepID=UPI002043D35C|nr:hypothetical protein [Frankia sp. R82]MCM3882140.1 hypothetical protein [Frankia sp. R82]